MANLGINDHYKKVTGITIDVQGLINACSSDDEKKALYNKLQWNIGLLVSCGNGCHEGKFLADGVTKASLLSDLYSLLVENDGISVEGVDQLKDLLDSKTKEELNELDIIINMANEPLTTETASIAAKSVKLSNVNVESTGLVVNSQSVAEISNVEVSGEKNASNARLSIKATEEIHISGVDFSKATSGYNCLEINLSQKNLAKKVVVEDCYFGNMTNNAILIFGMQEDGEVIIRNCKFDLATGGEAVRISNSGNAKHFTVTCENCTYKYVSPAHSPNNSKWLGFILFEDHNKTEVLEKPFAGLTINMKNIFRGTEKCVAPNIGANDESQFTCMVYDYTVGDRAKGQIIDPDHYPVFNFS